MPRIVALDWDDQEVRLVVAQQQAKDLTLEAIVSMPWAQRPRRGHQPVGTWRSESGRRWPSIADAMRTQSSRSDARRSSCARSSCRRCRRRNCRKSCVFSAARVLGARRRLADRFLLGRGCGNRGNDGAGRCDQSSSTRGVPEDRRAGGTEIALLGAATLRRGALLPHVPDQAAAEVQLMVDDFGSAIELTVLREQTSVFMRTVQPPASETPTAPERVGFLTGEIRRTILAVRNQLGGHPVQRIVLFGAGAEHDEFCRQLQERLQLDVQPVDPLQSFRLSAGLQRLSMTHSGRFAAALGMLLEQSQSQRPPIDFLHPRRVAPPKSRRLMLAAVGGTAALVSLCAVAGFWWHLRNLDQDIVRLQAQLQQGNPNVKAAEQRIAETAAVQQWLKGDINWLEQMRDVARQLPPPDRARVQELALPSRPRAMACSCWKESSINKARSPTSRINCATSGGESAVKEELTNVRTKNIPGDSRRP